MTANRILSKLWQDGAEFVSLNSLEKDSKNLYYNYNNMIQYLISRGFLFKILNDTYYVKSQDEFNSVSKKLKYSSLELISKALKFLGAEKWYFGLYTALKLNDISYDNGNDNRNDNDNGNTNYLIFSNLITTKSKITVCGQECKFIRLDPPYFKFGIKKTRNGLKYSDLEKTILDLMYLWHSSHMPNHKIKSGVLKYLKLSSIDTIKEYYSYYPESIQQLVDEMVVGILT
jgi:hypothetical protein